MRAQYDIAKRRRANEGWITPSTSANSEVGPALVMSRDRARDLVRNNAYAATIVDVWTAHIIGDGITCTWRNPDGTTNKARQDVWKAFADDGECDADGQLDFNGLQQLATRTMVEAGEVLVRRRIRRPTDGLTIPLQLQVLEPDHLDHSKNELTKSGGVIILGVQFNAIGRREGYWLYRNHPGDNIFSWQRQSVFVPADEVMHLYRKKRAGQVRGITWLAASGNTIKDMGDLRDARILKAKIEACQVGVIETPEDDNGPAVGETETGTNDRGDDLEYQTMEPGTWVRTRPGEKVTFSNPSSGGSHDEAARQLEQNIARGAGLTYDQLTGDLSRANFASLRAGKIEFRRDLSQIQWQVVIPMLCEPVGKSFDWMGRQAGLWIDDGARDVWMPPRNEPIDPKKDTDSELAEIAAGLESWSATVSRRGYDPRTLAEQIAADEELLKEFGLERYVNGGASKSPGQTDEEDNAQTA